MRNGSNFARKVIWQFGGFWLALVSFEGMVRAGFEPAPAPPPINESDLEFATFQSLSNVFRAADSLNSLTAACSKSPQNTNAFLQELNQQRKTYQETLKRDVGFISENTASIKDMTAAINKADPISCEQSITDIRAMYTTVNTNYRDSAQDANVIRDRLDMYLGKAQLALADGTLKSKSKDCAAFVSQRNTLFAKLKESEDNAAKLTKFYAARRDSAAANMAQAPALTFCKMGTAGASPGDKNDPSTITSPAPCRGLGIPCANH